jgi:hypothetical protein
MSLTVLWIALTFGAALADEVTVFRVDADCTQTNPTGRSWSYAFADLQDGIDAAFNAGGGEVWVKAGVYYPSGDDRNSTYELRPGIRLYGGFRGTEKSRDQRNPKANRTILNGDIGAAGNEADNAYHVVTGATDTHIDGFTISRGHANGLKKKSSGGGIFMPEGTRKMVLANCTFEKNLAGWQGGAVFGERVELVVTNCAFFSNSSASGGGLAIRGSSAVSILNSTFSANTASSGGGAVNLENKLSATIRDVQFRLNRSQGSGGALAVDLYESAELEITRCLFSDNSADRTGGAALIKGAIYPQISNSAFVRNTGKNGTGGIVVGNGTMALVQSCTFTKNRGMKQTDLSHDATSGIFENMEAMQSAGSPAEEEPEPEPLRMLVDAPVYGPGDEKRALRAIVSAKPYTVIVKGDLTDTVFIENYRFIEALAHDYKPLNVQCYYLHGALTHPENNGYLQPFNLKERRRQVQLAKSLLMTKVPWLYDGMDNQALAAVKGSDDSNVFVYNVEGGELHRGTLVDLTALRTVLRENAGTPPAASDPKTYPSPKVPARNPGKPDRLDRISFNPEKESFSALRIIPAESRIPFYAKLRVEADAELLDTGNGRLYLGFHLDPLYSTQWDNESDPLEYVIWSPVGIAAPSTDRAPEIKGTALDNEPREFVLTTRQLDLSKSLKLRVGYSVYSPLMERSITVSQSYTIVLEADPFGGEAYRRQIAHRDPARRNSAPMPFQLRHLDLNGDGRLSRAELSGNLWSKFPEIDTDRDGYMSEEEYRKYRTVR